MRVICHEDLLNNIFQTLITTFPFSFNVTGSTIASYLGIDMSTTTISKFFNETNVVN